MERKMKMRISKTVAAREALMLPFKFPPCVSPKIAVFWPFKVFVNDHQGGTLGKENENAYLENGRS